MNASIKTLLLGSALLLGACTTDQVNSTMDNVVTAFQTACLAMPQAHQDFLTIANSFSVKQSIYDAELKAYNAGVSFCGSGVVTITAAAVKTANGYVDQIRSAQTKAVAQ